MARNGYCESIYEEFVRFQVECHGIDCDFNLEAYGWIQVSRLFGGCAIRIFSYVIVIVCSHYC